jgi:hypothetical protein
MISTCNWLNLETPGSRPIVPKISPNSGGDLCQVKSGFQKDGAMVGKVVISGANIFRAREFSMYIYYWNGSKCSYLGGGGESRA